MDSRLQRVSGTRLVHLRYSDAPRVAQAIADAVRGKARVLSGQSHDTTYVSIVRDPGYTVVIRGDDWKLILPFLRYSGYSFKVVVPPLNAPPPIPSPQPNRVMQPPPVSPTGSKKTYLDKLPFPIYAKIQQLLTTVRITPWGKSRAQTQPAASTVSLDPPVQQYDISDPLYNQLVLVLQQLFPTDFPTRY